MGRREAGFTLLEMMLVMLLAAVAMSAVVLNLSRPSSKRSIDLFSQQLDVARQYSEIAQTLLGVCIDTQGWRFVTLQPQYQQNAEANQTWLSYRWALWEWRHKSQTGEAADGRLIFSSQEAMQVDRLGDDAICQPQVLILPGGDISAFTLRWEGSNKRPLGWITVNDTGIVSRGEGEKK